MAARARENPFESTRACLNFEERPITPPDIRKFRRSAAMEPGKSHSRFDDAAELGLKDKIFGMQSEAAVANASTLINLPKTTLVADIKTGKAEQIYNTVKREPLGKPYSRNYQLPEKCSTEAFGVKSVSSLEPAKGIIFPTVTEDVNAGTDLYKVSHGSYGPGEQKRRHYKWKQDVNTMTFGVKGTSVAFNGVSGNVDDVLKSAGESSSCVDTKSVEAYRKRGDILGQSRHLGQSSDERGLQFVYGLGKNKKQSYGTSEVCMFVMYSLFYMLCHPLFVMPPIFLLYPWFVCNSTCYVVFVFLCVVVKGEILERSTFTRC